MTADPQQTLSSAEVIPTGDRMVYGVLSSKGRKRYRVDLIAEGGFGSCACPDFGIRRWPNIKEGAEMGTRAVLCRHLILARRYFLNELLRSLAESEEAPARRLANNPP